MRHLVPTTHTKLGSIPKSGARIRTPVRPFATDWDSRAICPCDFALAWHLPRMVSRVIYVDTCAPLTAQVRKRSGRSRNDLITSTMPQFEYAIECE